MNKFGIARPILNSWYPEYAKITFWFPTLFLVGFLFSALLAIFNFPYFLYVYVIYFMMLFLASLKQNKSIEIAFYSLVATIIQFYGYGKGFLLSFIKIQILKQQPEMAFPKLFFKR